MGVGHLTRRAVFLDRDGVLCRAFVRNGKPHPPSSLEELQILPGVDEACSALHMAGFSLIMVTNQPDVARGIQTREVVEDINRAISDRLSLDDLRVCYHDDLDDCSCRKPKPGLLLVAAREWNIDLSASFMIGDRWKDIEAGQRAFCKTIFVCDQQYSEKKPERFDAEVKSLAAAVDWILQKTQSVIGE